MSPQDRITMLRIMGVHVELTENRQFIHVSGDDVLVEAAMATLIAHRDELVGYLNSGGDLPADASTDARFSEESVVTAYEDLSGHCVPVSQA